MPSLSDLAASSIPPLMLSMDGPEQTVRQLKEPNEIKLGMVGHRVVLLLTIDEVVLLHSRQNGDCSGLICEVLELRRVCEEEDMYVGERLVNAWCITCVVCVKRLMAVLNEVVRKLRIQETCVSDVNRQNS